MRGCVVSDVLGADHESARAGDDDVGAGDGVDEVEFERQAVLGGEDRAAAGGGVHPQVGRPVVAQRGDGGGGVLARADHEHGDRRPVGDAAASSSARRTIERPAAPSDVEPSPARGAGGALKDRLQAPRSSCRRRARRPQGTAHLPRDLVLADDDRLEARGHGEQVARRLSAGEHGDRAHGARRSSTALAVASAAKAQVGAPSPRRVSTSRYASKRLQVASRTRRAPNPSAVSAPDTSSADRRQSFEHVETRVSMVGRKADEHVTKVNGVTPSPPSATVLRVGTRGSALALAQTESVRGRLERPPGARRGGDDHFGGRCVIRLAGVDRRHRRLRRRRCATRCSPGSATCIVHSLKDLPTAPHPGLAIAAVPAARGRARRALRHATA